MSASNWAVCPKCKEKAEQVQAKLLGRVETDYGRLPAGEYLELVEQSKQPVELAPTLREDWGLGIWKDEFSVYYGANCEKCGFSHEFKHKEKIC